MRAVLVLLAVTVLLAGWMVLDAPSQTGTCDAPCTVVFPLGTQEDDWNVDYTYEDGVPVLRVSVTNPMGGM